MNFSRLLIIFFIFHAQLFAQDLNTQLMKAIKDGNKASVQKALDLGADINHVDIASRDTPAFYALTCALETAIYAKDGYAYRLYANKNLRMYEGACGLALVPILIGTFLIGEKTGLLKETKAGEFPHFAVLAPVISLGACYILAQLPRINFSMSVRGRIEIITYLLEQDSLNMQYKHPAYHKTISEFLDFLLIQRNAGYICTYLYRDGTRIGDAVSSYQAACIQLAKEHTIYLETYTKHIIPVLKRIKAFLKVRLKG